MLYERMLNESRRLEKEINSLQVEIQKLPEGKLICSRNRNYYKWYQSDGTNQIYISKKERHLAEKLAVKKYLSVRLKNKLQEKKAADSYLKHCNINASLEENQLMNTPGYQELLSPIFSSKSKELLEWMNAPYEKLEKYPEQLIHKTYSGISVRSKSESLIAMFLFKNKIPFRYECALQLGEVVFYPDFTIRHPETGEVFYWEHFGLMDNPNYIRNANSKLQLYTSNGIIPTIQLITTYETKENPLNSEMVEKIVEYYFL